MSAVEQVLSELGDVYRRHPWMIATDVLQGWVACGTPLQRMGSVPVFVLAARMGTGPVPEGVPWHVLGLPMATDIVQGIHSAERGLRALPPAVQADLDRRDPQRTWRVLADFFGTGQPVGGRAVFGARPAAWQALEDKVIIDAVWDAAGVPRAPSQTVPVAAGWPAAVALDEGEGTVWAGDARDGFHGGAVRTFWVRTEAEAAEATRALSPACDRIRVMPFLEGIPCSIHGIVLPDGVVVLRPAEMLVLRRERRFVYARAATYWDPPPARRAAMRQVARRVGEHLRRTVDYRGAFTIDGVMTAAGFRPTELNPRVGAAMSMVGGGLPHVLWHYALIEGYRPSCSAADLEAEMLLDADGRRAGSFGFTVSGPMEQAVHHVRWVDDGWRRASEETAEAVVRCGPGSTGGFVNVQTRHEAMPVGPSFAPRVAAFAGWCDENLGTGIGVLQPARSLS